MSIVLLGSTSGSVTLQEPAVAGSTVIDLPATSGTMAVLPTATSVLPQASGGTGTSVGYNGFKNRVINGAMVIDQRNAGASTSFTNNLYTLDRWVSVKDSSAVGTIQQSSSSPAPNFTNFLRVTCTTGSAPTSAQYNMIWYKFEGFNTADFGWGTSSATAVTVSFWVRSSLTGTFAAGVFNGNTYANGYVFNYTISAANTWTYVTASIPAIISGTWQTNNTNGITLQFDLGTGSGSASTPNVWGGVAYTTTGATQVMANTGATWDVTGVQLEKGSTATSFDYRSIGTELALCQRYYQKSNPGVAENAMFNSSIYEATTSWNYATGTGSITPIRPYAVTMRATPVVTLYTTQASSSATPNRISLYQTSWTNLPATAISDANGFSFFHNGASVGMGYCAYNFSSSAEL